MICKYRNQKGIIGSNEIQLKDCCKIIIKALHSAQRVMCVTDKEHMLYAIRLYSGEEIEKLMIYKNIQLTDDELDAYVKEYSGSVFCVLHKGTCKPICEKIMGKMNKRQIRPITLKTANDFVNKYHRHHNGTIGCKFAIGLFEDDKIIGAAICGRPVSRYLDYGEICEINRVCTLGDENACSMLYGACSRIAKNMGYKKIITYTLKSESGITLKASNFSCDGVAGGTHWTGKRDREQAIPHELKIRWSKILTE